MPENTSKLLGLLEDLAIIADDVAQAGDILSIYMSKNRAAYEWPVKILMNSLDKLKKHYPGKTEIKDHSDEYFQESMIFFDTVQIFCLIEKPKPEVDINVVPAELAI